MDQLPIQSRVVELNGGLVDIFRVVNCQNCVAVGIV